MKGGVRLISIVGLISAVPISAHDAPLDSYGCHPNVAHGSYHCHTGPLAGRQYASKERMVQAYKERQRAQRPKPKRQAPGY